MLRPLGIDNTVIVDVFPLNTMTQAQIDLQKQAQVDLQNQLEQAPATDLTTRPLLNDSPVLYIETSEQTLPTFLEQMEHTKVDHENPKTATPHDDTDHTQATTPPPKKRYEIMKDPVFLSSLIYPPSIPSKISLCTNRDDHWIPPLSHGNFVFKSQLNFLYMHPTDYSFRLFDKNQDFFTSIASELMGPYQYWLDNGVKIFSLQFNFLCPSIYDLKQMNQIHLSFLFHKKLLKRTLNFYNTRNHKIKFLSIINIHHRLQRRICTLLTTLV